MIKNFDGSITFNNVEYIGRSEGKERVSDKVTPTSVEENWTNKLKDVRCIMCNRRMTVKKFELHPYYCYKCNDEVEGVFNNG